MPILQGDESASGHVGVIQSWSTGSPPWVGSLRQCPPQKAHFAMSLDRRRFLATLSISAVAFALPACRESTEAAVPTGNVAVDRSRFPQSVASGDPRPDRVLLWTRVASSETQQTLWLQVSDNVDFALPRLTRSVLAEAEHDHCVRLRLTDLPPATTLYYRFLLDTPSGWVSSPSGRTRTAPEEQDQRPVRFAFMSCQDFGGRWYNSLLPLLSEELDFVLHLGDFIYETAGDPSFQDSSSERRIAFDDVAGAIRLGEGERTYFAASSLSNYRQLHRTFRTDPVLQQVLERAPLVAIWDDHEFADDSWQDHATATDGREDEGNSERRRNAEQAYFEYLPVDIDAVVSHPNRDELFPNMQIWRKLRFGAHLELFLTDTRSERPDHLIPEDAFPGAVIFDQPTLLSRLPQLGLDMTAVTSMLMPYVNLDQTPFSTLQSGLAAALAVGYGKQGLSPEHAQIRAVAASRGLVAWPVLQAIITAWNTQAPEPLRLSLPPLPSQPLYGLCWASLGKSSLFGATGSRYFVTRDGYRLYSDLLALDAIKSPLSAAQQTWLLTSMQTSNARWKAVASSISMTPIVLDLARPELQAPELMQRQFLLNVDHWDGFPQAKRALLDAFDAAGGAIVLSGDIHAAFVCQHSERTVEFTVPAVSSKTLADILASEVEKDPSTAEVGRRLVAALDALIQSGDPALRHAETRVHGVGIAEVSADSFSVRMPVLPSGVCLSSGYDNPDAIAAARSVRHFVVDATRRKLTIDSGPHPA